MLSNQRLATLWNVYNSTNSAVTLAKHQKTHTKEKMETNLHYQHFYSGIQNVKFCFCIVMIYTHIKRREPDIVAFTLCECMGFWYVFLSVVGFSFNTHTYGTLVFSMWDTFLCCLCPWMEHEWNRKISLLPISLFEMMLHMNTIFFLLLCVLTLGKTEILDFHPTIFFYSI